jgi:hypothetical protein
MGRLKVAALFLLFAAVTTQAQDSVPSAGQSADAKSTVYIYRYKQFVGSGLEPSVYCDEAPLARMDNGRYFSAKVDAGKHVFRSNDPQSGVTLDMKASEEYFLRVEIATGFMKGHGRLVMMSPQQAIYELQSAKLKPLDSAKVVDKTRVSVEEAHPKAQAAKSKAAPVAPVPAQTNPALTPVKASGDEHVIPGMVISDPDREISLDGETTSVGEAARRNREKKQPPK